MSGRPARTKERRRQIARESYRRMMERRELDAVRNHCDACSKGIHDPLYADDGICRCMCCGKDLTDEVLPCLSRV